MDPVDIYGFISRDNAGNRVIGLAADLGGPDLAVGNIDGQHVGKRAADVDADFPGARIRIVHIVSRTAGLGVPRDILYLQY